MSSSNSKQPNHSPAPWRYNQSLAIHGKHPVYDANGDLVALEGAYKKSEAEKVANAFLMQAAPDLLKACLDNLNAKTQAQLDASLEAMRQAVQRATSY